ncbi:MAG TPA: Com family DNA-binding transcriptional regulator [Patescibacteria group bacterium]
MREYRCSKDNKLLMKACLIGGDVEIKCRHCGRLNQFKGDDKLNLKYLCYKYPCEHRIYQPE